MEFPRELMDRAKKKLGTYAEVARQMDVSEQTLKRIRNGRCPMSAHIAIGLAEISGDDPKEAALKVMALHAISDRQKAVWQRLGYLPAIILAATLAFAHAPNSYALSSGYIEHVNDDLYIIRSYGCRGARVSGGRRAIFPVISSARLETLGCPRRFASKISLHWYRSVA